MDIDLLKNLKISENDTDELADDNRDDVGKKGDKVLKYGKTDIDWEIGKVENANTSKKIVTEQKKQKILRELDKELYYLGIKEGKVTESRDPEDLSANKSVEYRGVLRKRVKNGLIMEYIFTSPERGIKNFHLNNVKIELDEMPDDKLEKLLIIVRFYNEKYREADNSLKSDKEKKMSDQEQEKLEEEKREESRRKLVLGKL